MTGVQTCALPICYVDSILQVNPKLKELLDQVKAEKGSSCCGGATLESVLATPGQNAISVGCCTGKNQAGGISINEEELRKIIHEVAKNMR